MTVVVTHTTPADSSFSSTGAAAWNADHALSGVGTMAEQDANAVAITGGTINGATVGATTPAAGTFTTLTAQTEVLKGTGQNLLLQSNTFSNATWIKTGITVATSGTTDPFGGTAAFSLTPTAGSAEHTLYQGSLTTVVGMANTFSCYIKANGYNFAFLRTFDYTANFTQSLVMFNLSTGAVGTITGANTTASITSVGNGWYRCLCIFTSVQNGAFRSLQVGASPTDTNTTTFNGDGTSGVFIYASQLEIGSVANTYTATTTAAIYGTPTLSFSGVAGLGLQSDGSLYHQPAGTGAVQAQATTSTATGGNARGANAVDWQTTRGAAAQVASGQVSFIGGGQNNTSSSYGTVVCGGANSSATGANTFVGAGTGLTSSGAYATAVGGAFNTAAGQFNFIGGGASNSGTALAAVTTQSATMNGTTAVTLSGSNANIKVGQYISGTSIGFGTYVAAISGTSLTLSQAASGSSTSTLSFYTPHGVVVGGGNNQATGSYSFIGGGGDAGTAANRNQASGDYSFVGGGKANTASGLGSVVVGGGTFAGGPSPNTASGAASFVGGGFNNFASNFASIVIGGNGNTSSGNYSFVTGVNGSTRSINNSFAISSNALSNTGDSQTAILVIRRQTTDATATVLTSDGLTAATNNQVILPNNSAYYFRGTVVAGVTGGGNTKGWTVEGVIKRGANAAATTLVGSTVTSMYGDVGAATWVIALSADTTNGGLAVTFTGQAATTIRTVCQISTTEMTY